MQLPLRPFVMFASGVLCLSACYCAGAGNKQPAPSLSASPGTNASGPAPPPAAGAVILPGPLRPLLRMAGISQEVSPGEVIPLLARNIYLLGYQSGGQTEFLILLNRYVEFARELRLLSGADGMIRVTECGDAARLIHVLGYQFQQTCGQKNSYLVAANTERAFLTLDSGFPLTRLEDSLRNHISFSYSFPATPVPILFYATDWIGASSFRKKGTTDMVDVLLHDRDADRLYWAISKEDEETQAAMRQSPGLRTLLPLAPVLDFYGSQICIRSGRVLVPGGPDAEHAWEDLVGASPGSPGRFVPRLLGKDLGWLAAFFDAASRVSRDQQVHLTQAARLKRMYEVYRRAGSNSIGSNFRATSGVFPKNADLLLLFTRVQWQPDGDPYVPGTMAIWKEILDRKPTPELIRGWVKHAPSWNDPDQLLLAMVACSGFEVDAGPMQAYLTLSAIDDARKPGIRLSEQSVRLLADNFSEFHVWELIFSEFPALNDASIAQFMKAAESVSGIHNPTLRANAIGAFQANVGLWQILARQQEISPDKINPSWLGVIEPFIAISSSTQLFDASRNSLRSLMISADGNPTLSQSHIIDVLAGPRQHGEAGRRVHDELAARMDAVLNDQQLVSLDVLFGLYDGLDKMAHGSAMRDRLLPLAADLREFELPRPIFTRGEKLAWRGGIYSTRHAELQVRTDLAKVIKAPRSAQQLEAARAQLTPFLRDTLVGLNYAYYEPPGAQTLHHNPLLVRSHDFSAVSIENYSLIWDTPDLVGVGVTAGGGAYLIRSLADLPYALALTEEDFIVPENVQALIWKAEVPNLMVSAIQPRWWQVSSTELHAAALYQRFGEELLTASAENANLRKQVIDILNDVMQPKRLEMTERALLEGSNVTELIRQMTPAEEFYLAAEIRKKSPAYAGSWGAAGRELDDLARRNPSDTDPERVSKDFGVPHPIMGQTNAFGIMNVKPFPAFPGTSYRLLGESWQSSNLYWARLADEMGYPPVMLNLLAPELTRDMVAKIFATDLEDWPAVMRAMQETGAEFRERRTSIATNAASY